MAANVRDDRITLAGARVALAGKFVSMTRKEIARLIGRAGAELSPLVSSRTGLLVVGLDGWPLQPDGRLSRKIDRARVLAQEGCPVRVISEEKLAAMLPDRHSLPDPKPWVNGATAQRLTGIEPETLAVCEELGLLSAKDGRYEYVALASLRTLAQLVASGVAVETVAASLRSLEPILPDVGTAFAQIPRLVQVPRALLSRLCGTRARHDAQLSFEFAEAVDESGGAVIAFTPRDDLSAAEYFERGQLWEEEENYERAAEAYRRALGKEPRFPEALFNLGNVVRALGRSEAAIEIFRLAAAVAPDMAECWYNIADIQEEQGRVEEALAALQTAVRARPEYADAHFNLARGYEMVGEVEKAHAHWANYLRLDPFGEWADIARKHITSNRAELPESARARG